MKKALIGILLATSALAAVGIQSAGTVSANNWFVNTFGSGTVARGRSARATYTASAGGLATTAAYSMQLEAEAARGFHVAEICVSTSVATAAALQTVTIRRATRRAQKIEDLVPKAVDAALAHVSPAEQALLDVRRVATRFAIHLDAEDGKRDFSDERLYSEVCAELARRKL